MKKKIVNVLLTAAVITTMMFSITACGSKEDDIQEADADMVESDTTQQEATESVEATDIEEQDVDETDIQEDSTGEELEEDETTEATDSELIIADEQDETDVEYIYVDGQEADVEETQEPKAEKKEKPKAAEKEAMTLEKWIQSDECAQFSEMMKEGLDGMAISYEVNGDMLSMIFTMTGASENAEGEMNEYFEGNAVIFEAIRDQLISETKNGNIVLRVVYRNADGSDIFSMDF